MTENYFQKVFNYPRYPRGSKFYSDKKFAKIDNGQTGGTHWICFKKMDNKLFYIDCFGGPPDKFLLIQLPKPITSHKCDNQGFDSRLCGRFCLHFFYLIEMLHCYHAILQMYFG